MKMSKRILALVLSFLMIVMYIPAEAFAAEVSNADAIIREEKSEDPANKDDVPEISPEAEIPEEPAQEPAEETPAEEEAPVPSEETPIEDDTPAPETEEPVTPDEEENAPEEIIPEEEEESETDIELPQLMAAPMLMALGAAPFGASGINTSTNVDWKLFYGYNTNKTMTKTDSTNKGTCIVKVGDTVWGSTTPGTSTTTKVTIGQIASGGITIIPSFGYYVKQVVIACNDDGGYGCQTAQRDGIAKFGNSSTTSTEYKIAASNLGVNAKIGGNPVWHSGAGTPLHLMIWLAPAPNPVTVVYNAGTAGGTNVSVDKLIAFDASKESQPSGASLASGYPKYTASTNTIEYKFGTDSTKYLEHTILDCETKTVVVGGKTYAFDGWKVEYEIDDQGKTGWNEASGSSAVGAKLSLYTNYKVTALWKEVVTYNVTASATNGVASPTSQTVAAGSDSESITFTPNEGYALKSVTVDNGTAQTSGDIFNAVKNGSYKFTNVTKDHDIKAVYAARTDLKYTVNYYLVGTTTKVKDSDTKTGKTFGQTYNETAPSISGYTHDSSDASSKSVKIVVDETKNVINFYYKKNITLTANDRTAMYDGTEKGPNGYTITAGALMDGDSIDDSTVTIEGGKIVVGTYTGEFVIQDGVVIKKGTTNVTSHYKITLEPGDLTINRREGDGYDIRLSAIDKRKVYDGTPLSASTSPVLGTDYKFDSNSGALCDGDSLVVVTSGTITDAGKTDHIIKSVKIMRGSTDVTTCYCVASITNAKLYVDPREVTLVSADASKEYDGTPLTKDEVKVSGTDFVSGEGVDSYDVTGSQTDVGTSDNTFDYTLKDNTKSSNYTIKKVPGTLKVTKNTNKIVITPADDEKVYDGTPLSNSDYEYTQGVLSSSDVLTAVIEGSQTDVGTSDNVVKSYKVMRGSKDVTDYYTFDEENFGKGTLEVTPRTVYLVSADDEKVYDGTPLTNDTVTVSGTDFVDGEGADYEVTGSQTDVGNSSNTFTYTLKSNTKEGNYNIIKKEGTLVVKSSDDEIIIKASSAKKVYDGKPLSNSDYTFTENVLVAGDVLTAVVEGSQTDFGTSKNVVTSYKVTRDGKDVTGNYKFGDSIDGELEVTKREVILVSADDEKEYDGTPLTNSTVTASGTDFVDGEGADYDVTGSQLDVGSSDNEFTYTLKSGTKEDNYDIKTVFGTLKVNKVSAVINVSASDAEKTYDGKPLSSSDFDYTQGILVAGDELVVVVEGTITDYGTEDNEITSCKVMRGTTDVTDNYTFGTKKNGTLTIKKRPLTITPASNSWKYDSLTHSDSDFDEDGLVSNTDTLEVVISGSIKDPGTVDNIVDSYTITRNKQDVSFNYEVTKEKGVLEITTYDVAVTVKTASDEKIFDGTALTAESFEITSGTLDEGDTVVATVYCSGRTNVGSCDNTATFIIEDSEGHDVTPKYTNFTAQFGTLTVTPAEIEVQLGSAEKVYDGTPLSCSDYEVSPTELVKGYSLTVEMNDYLINVGNITMEDYKVTLNVPSAPLRAGSLFSKNNVKNASPMPRLMAAPANPDVPTSKNYTIRVIPGTLKVTPRVIEITAGSDEKYYDGEPLECDEWELTDGTLAKGEEIENVDVTGSQTDPGTSENVASNAVIKNANDQDVTTNYSITYVNGTLTVKERIKITITAGSDTKTYDGKPLECDEWELTDGTLSGSDVIESVVVTGSQTDPGTSKNVASDAKIVNANGADVTYMYEITYIDGLLTVCESPKTGDNNVNTLLMGVMIFSWFSMALLWRSKKREYEE